MSSCSWYSEDEGAVPLGFVADGLFCGQKEMLPGPSYCILLVDHVARQLTESSVVIAWRHSQIK